MIKCEITKDKNYIFLDILLNSFKEQSILYINNR